MSLSRLASTRWAASVSRSSCLRAGAAATATRQVVAKPAGTRPRGITTKPSLRRPYAEQHHNAAASTTLPPLSASSRSATSSALPLPLRMHNALHQATRLFPSSDDIWASRCHRAASELTSRTKAKIAVVGVDARAARNVLTALLDDPLAASARVRSGSSEEEQLQREFRAVRERQAKGLRITHGDEASFAEGSMTLPLPWLKDTEIIEAIDLEAAEDMVYASDSLILVVSAQTLSRVLQCGAVQSEDKLIDGEIRRRASWYSTQLVIDTSSVSSVDASLDAAALKAHFPLARDPLYINARQAEQANDALRKALAPGASEVAAHWQAFQANYAASNLARLHDLVVSPPLEAAYELPGLPKAQQLALQTASRLLEDAVLEAESRVLQNEADVSAAQGLAQVLEQQAEATLAELRERVLATPAVREGVPNSTPSNTRVHERAGDRSSAAIGALTDSGAQLEQALSKRLPWWKLGWKVDDVGAEVESAVLRSFAKDLEEQLIFEAGRLLTEAESQSRLTHEALSGLAHRAPSFASSVLLNEVSQRSVSSARAALHPRSLSAPIAARRTQLLSVGGPVDALVARAQGLVFSTYPSLLTLGLACTATSLARHPKLASVPWLGESLPGALEPLAMSPATAGGVFTLGAAALAWRMQGKWGKSKTRFWRDWERLARGLDADLEETVTRLLREHIVAQPLAASTALSAMVLRRTSELQLQRATLEHVQREFDALQAQHHEVRHATKTL